MKTAKRIAIGDVMAANWIMSHTENADSALPLQILPLRGAAT